LCGTWTSAPRGGGRAGSAPVAAHAGSGAGDISEALWQRDGRLAWWPSVTRSVLSIVIVGLGLGASLGREAVPQLTGAAWGCSP
jgi:H+/Cl- antiporter ClcA